MHVFRPCIDHQEQIPEKNSDWNETSNENIFWGTDKKIETVKWRNKNGSHRKTEESISDLYYKNKSS